MVVPLYNSAGTCQPETGTIAAAGTTSHTAIARAVGLGTTNKKSPASYYLAR